MLTAITVAEFCAAARLGRTKVNELIKTGAIRSVKIGYARRILAGELERILATGTKGRARLGKGAVQ